MAPIERRYDEGTRRAGRALADIGSEFRETRLQLGLTQREVAAAARIDRADYCRIEAGKLPYMTWYTAYRIASVLGLDLVARIYHGDRPIRDIGQTPRIQQIARCIGSPLRHRLEVVLPRKGDFPERRAWDLVAYGHGERTAFEYERALRDIQAQLRRFELKRRDDPVDHFVLAVSDTKGNRRVLAEFADLFADLPRLRTSAVLGALQAGHHPPSGIILL